MFSLPHPPDEARTAQLPLGILVLSFSYLRALIERVAFGEADWRKQAHPKRQEWEAFVAVWHEAFGLEEVTAADLMNVAEEDELFAFVFSKRSPQARGAAFGKLLRRHIDSEAYVHAPEIIGTIQVPGAMTLRQFQTRVVAELRDAGVLIASDSRGYKLPSKMRDVLEYLRWTNKQVEPMVVRAKRMAEAVQLATNNRTRPLEHEEFRYLRGPP